MEDKAHQIKEVAAGIELSAFTVSWICDLNVSADSHSRTLEIYQRSASETQCDPLPLPLSHVSLLPPPPSALAYYAAIVFYVTINELWQGTSGKRKKKKSSLYV